MTLALRLLLVSLLLLASACARDRLLDGPDDDPDASDAQRGEPDARADAGDPQPEPEAEPDDQPEPDPQPEPEPPGCVDRDDDGAAGTGADCQRDDPDLDCDDGDPGVHPGAAELCDGADDDCDGVFDEGTINACGGCATLSPPPGQACGDCGRVICQGPEDTTCDEGRGNICGGCGQLEGVPGERCGQCGQWACVGPDLVTCDDAPTNDCGGCAPLSNPPGQPCGRCDSGRWACQGADGVRCQGEGALNACGGCEALQGSPGDPCGQCGALRCEGDRLACLDRPSTRYHRDGDSDGYGANGDARDLCDGPEGRYTATRAGDCDDNNGAINPGAEELCDATDQNCDGDPFDGFGDVGGDCENQDGCGTRQCTSPSRVACVVTINRTRYFHDGDGDGYGSPAFRDLCEPSGNFRVLNDDDCNDSLATMHPNQLDPCNGVNDDCDGAVDEDPGCPTNAPCSGGQCICENECGEVCCSATQNCCDGVCLRPEFQCF